MERIDGSAPGLVKATEVARRLGLSKTMVYKLVASGDLPHIQFGKAIRFHPEDVLAFITYRRREGKVA